MVVIDVLRAFTVSAYALAGGAREILYVADLEQARRLAAAIPGAVLSAEVDGLPVEGVAISNSPTQVAAADLAGRTLVQRSSAGVQALAAVAPHAEGLLAAGLVVARATVEEIRRRRPELVTLLPSVLEHDEDVACANALEELLEGRQPDLDALLAPLRASQRFAELATGTRPGFPATDLDLALALDRFDFPLPVETGEDGLLRVRPRRPPGFPNI